MTTPTTAGDAARDALLRLLAPQGVPDPYPLYATLRDHAPVYRPEGFGTCFVSGYPECQEALSGDAFAVQDPAWFDERQPGWRENTATRYLYQGLQSRNPPDHTRLRRLLGGAFGARRMQGLRASVEDLVDALLDELAERGADGRPVDLMEALAFPLPVAVVGRMLGVPERDRARYRELTSAYLGIMDLLVSEGTRRRAHEAAEELRAYWLERLAAQRGRPGPQQTLTARLAQAHEDGQATLEEAVSTLMFVFSAGYGTTAALIGNTVSALLARPGRSTAAGPAGVGPLIEETLRYESPGQIASRMAVREVRLGGVDLPAGQHLTLLLGAANRDPRRFEDPDRFDPARYADRSAPALLSFGGGIHYCLGAPLSRLEAGIAVERLLHRFPGLCPGGPEERRLGLRMRIHSRLPVLLNT